MKQHDKIIKGRFTFKCPNCKNTFRLRTGRKIPKSFTCDCPHCNSLLLHEGNLKLVDFHKAMNKECPAWPADGKNTGYVEI